jgi:hypothetical protein
MHINETNGLKLIGSARHVLLNDLQLIKGYLFLNRVGKANELIDQVTVRLRIQAQLSHLQIPECAFYLITYSWSAHPFLFSVRVDGQETDLSGSDRTLALFFRKFFGVLESFASETETNRVSVVYSLNRTPVTVTALFEGTLTDPAHARSKMASMNPYRTLRCVEHYEADDSVPNKVRWEFCLSI